LVGTVANGAVTWSIVDGVPAGAPVAQNGILPDADGWRGGVSAAGDHVGEWNAIAFAPSGAVAVSYYDRTNGALKYATSSDGWRHVVHPDGLRPRTTPGSSPRSRSWRRASRDLVPDSMTPTEDVAVAPHQLRAGGHREQRHARCGTDWVVTPCGASGTAIGCNEDLCGGGLVCRA
jgi:hypothetical protein